MEIDMPQDTPLIERPTFERELESLINKHAIENKCDMPDFILAKMIINFIDVIGESIKKNLDWHGCDSICHPKKKTKEQ